jgi:hypothetical protein
VDDASFTTSNGKSFLFFFLIKKKVLSTHLKKKKKKANCMGLGFLYWAMHADLTNPKHLIFFWSLCIGFYIFHQF